MSQYESTLCWECKNTHRDKCSWFNPADPQPVPGWVADRYVKPVLGETYMVKECPNFDPEPPREAPAPPPVERIHGVHRNGRGWEAVINHKKKHYYLGLFPSFEEAAAARRAAEEALARGEEPKCKRYQRKEPPPKKVTPPGYCPGVQPRGRSWTARIKRNGREYYLGYFNTEEEAIAARRAAEEALARGEEPQRPAPPAEAPHPAKRPEKKPPAERSVCGVRRGVRNWHAYIQHQGKVYNLGYFKTEEKAIAARKAAEKAIKRGEIPAH